METFLEKLILHSPFLLITISIVKIILLLSSKYYFATKSTFHSILLVFIWGSCWIISTKFKNRTSYQRSRLKFYPAMIVLISRIIFFFFEVIHLLLIYRQSFLNNNIYIIYLKVREKNFIIDVLEFVRRCTNKKSCNRNSMFSRIRTLKKFFLRWFSFLYGLRCKDIITFLFFPASSIAKKMLSMSLVIMFDIVWLIFAPSTPLIDAIKIPFALRQFSSRGNLGPSLLFIFTTPECSVNILVIFTDYYWFFTFFIFISIVILNKTTNNNLL